MEPNIRLRPDHHGHDGAGAELNEEVGRNGEGDSHTFLNAEEIDLDDYDLVIEYIAPRDNADQNGTPWETYHRCVVLFILYVLYEATVFYFLFLTGLLTYEFFTVLSWIEIPLFGLFSYIGSYYCVIHLCLVSKLLHDHVEQKFPRLPEFEILYGMMPNFKCVYSWISLCTVGICYWTLFAAFHEKCKLLTLENEMHKIDCSAYVLCLCYIHYFNVVHSISGSERATAFHQIMQNGINIFIGTMILRFGHTCGMFLLLEGVEIKTTTIVFVLITICLTLICAGLEKVVFHKLNMGSGTKWAELLWSCLATDFILKAYFGILKSENIEAQTIQFQAGVSYIMYLTTKLVVGNFGKVYLPL